MFQDGVSSHEGEGMVVLTGNASASDKIELPKEVRLFTIVIRRAGAKCARNRDRRGRQRRGGVTDEA